MPRAILASFLWLAALMILAVSVVIARITGDGHWINRGGATIAAMAAGAVLLQIMVEIELEKESRDLPAPPDLPAYPSPRELLEHTLAAKGREARMASLHQDRLQVALRVAVTAIIGELLHGFGDVATCGWLVECHC